MARHLLVISCMMLFIAVAMEKEAFSFVIIVLIICCLLSWKYKQLLYFLPMLLLLMIIYQSSAEQSFRKSAPDFLKSFKISAEPLIDGDRFQAIVTQGKQTSKMSYVMNTENEKDALRHIKPGDNLQISGETRSPNRAKNPHQFDERLYLKYQHIHHVITAVSIDKLADSKPSWHTKILQLRHYLLAVVTEKAPSKVGSYTRALIFGERDSLEEETVEAYRSLGVIHLLAISGLHVHLIGASLFMITLYLGATRRLSASLAIVFLLFYLVLAGANAPVVRAVSMMCLLFFNEIIPSKISTFTALIISFNLQILLDHYQLFSIGFQLSYAVCLGLVLSRNIIRQSQSRVVEGLKISIIATLMSLPLISYHFFEISLASIWSNLIFVPLYTLFIIPACLGTALILPLFEIPTPLLTLFEKVLSLSETFAIKLNELPFNTYITGRAPLVSYFIIVVLLWSFFIAWERKCYLKTLTLLLIITILSLPIQTQWSNKGRVVMIDVGQGDSLFIQLPNNKGNMLIDTGGQFDWQPREEWQKRKRVYTIGKNVLNPTLKALGVSRIDQVILTHSDFDHMGALVELAEEIKLGEIIIGRGSASDKLLATMLTKLKAIPQREVVEGDELVLGKIRFTVLNPQAEGGIGENRDSVVLHAVIAGKSWLFTGDMEKEQEQRIMKEYPKLGLDYLMVAHHGSKHSTDATFVENMQPKEAWISVAEKSRYGHPHPEVLEILANNNVRIRSTALEGALIYHFDY